MTRADLDIIALAFERVFQRATHRVELGAGTPAQNIAWLLRAFSDEFAALHQIVPTDD